MMNAFDEQARAIRYAIKELQLARRTAETQKDTEWMEQIDKHVKNLTAAIASVEAMKAIKQALAE